MNIRYIIYAVIAIMLVVALGRNPIAEIRDKNNAWKKGKDPLAVSIEEYQKENKGKRFGAAPRYRGETTNPAAANRYKAPPAANYYNPNNPAGKNPGLQAPDNSYYPPPPEGGVKPNLPPRSQGPSTLDDGTQVVYQGSEVYKTDSDGKQVPLPDGKYAMFGGKMNMYVQDGHRTLDPN